MYAGWIVLDLRMIIFILLISLFLTTSIVTMFVRNRAWHEYMTIFVALYSLAVVLQVVVLNVLLSQPVLRIEALFPFP